MFQLERREPGFWEISEMDIPMVQQKVTKAWCRLDMTLVEARDVEEVESVRLEQLIGYGDKRERRAKDASQVANMEEWWYPFKKQEG